MELKSAQISQRSNAGKYMHEIDNYLFVLFFKFMLRKFEELYPGCKRWNWIPDTQR